jgi:hypothetical protein
VGAEILGCFRRLALGELVHLAVVLENEVEDPPHEVAASPGDHDDLPLRRRGDGRDDAIDVAFGFALVQEFAGREHLTENLCSGVPWELSDGVAQPRAGHQPGPAQTVDGHAQALAAEAVAWVRRLHTGEGGGESR